MRSTAWCLKIHRLGSGILPFLKHFFFSTSFFTLNESYFWWERSSTRITSSGRQTHHDHHIWASEGNQQGEQGTCVTPKSLTFQGILHHKPVCYLDWFLSFTSLDSPFFFYGEGVGGCRWAQVDGGLVEGCWVTSSSTPSTHIRTSTVTRGDRSRVAGHLLNISRYFVIYHLFLHER